MTPVTLFCFLFVAASAGFAMGFINYGQFIAAIFLAVIFALALSILFHGVRFAATFLAREEKQAAERQMSYFISNNNNRYRSGK